MHLGDWVMWALESSADPRLSRARALLARVRQRNLYQAVYIPTHVPADIRSEEEAQVFSLLLFALQSIALNDFVSRS